MEIVINSFSLRFKESLFLLYVKLYLFNAAEFFKVNKLFKNLSKPLNSNNAEKMSEEELIQLINNVKLELENKHLYY